MLILTAYLKTELLLIHQLSAPLQVQELLMQTGCNLRLYIIFQNKEQWTADGNYFAGKNDGNTYYANKNYDAAGNFTGNFNQQQLSTGNNKFFTMQTDYTNPLTKNTKLEAGLRAQINKLSNINDLYFVNGSDITKLPGSSVNYHNTNN